MDKNLHAEQIPADVLQQGQNKVKELLELIKPYCIELTATEKSRMFMLGSKMQSFVDEAFKQATDNPALASTNVNMAEFAIDKNDAAELNRLMAPIIVALNLIGDTQMLAGSEALRSALNVYTNAQFMAKQGNSEAKVAYETLKEHYPIGRRKKAAADTPAA